MLAGLKSRLRRIPWLGILVGTAVASALYGLVLGFSYLNFGAYHIGAYKEVSTGTWYEVPEFTLFGFKARPLVMFEQTTDGKNTLILAKGCSRTETNGDVHVVCDGQPVLTANNMAEQETGVFRIVSNRGWFKYRFPPSAVP